MDTSSKYKPDNASNSMAYFADQISSLTAQISSYLSTKSCAEPNLKLYSGNVPETTEYEALRSSLNDAALDLLRLVNGPKRTLRTLMFSHYDLAALQVALDRRFFDHIPVPFEEPGQEREVSHQARSASLSDIASKADMDKDRTGRVLKLLTTLRILEEVDGAEGQEDEGPYFAHTAASALLASDLDLHATADMQMDDMLGAVSELSAQISSAPYASDIVNSAFHRHYGVSMYEYYTLNPVKGTRFAQAMSSWAQMDRQVDTLYEGYPWTELENGTVVDIGGGSGHISIALAHRFPKLRFVVQDISAHMLSQAQAADLGNRVTFMQHNFFDTQPIHDASAYLLRQCLHNYADKDAVKILSAVVPALECCKPKTPLLINDVILPDRGSGATLSEEHHLRQVDMCMMVTLGAKQRSASEFENLLKRADERFKVFKVHRNPLGVGLLEAYLEISV